MKNKVKSTQKNFCGLKNNCLTEPISENGRSMVEMLGVLAVIGVLTIAGITGYSFAMDKYLANKLVNELNIVRTDLDLAMERRAMALVLNKPYDEGGVNTSANYEFDYDCGDGSSGTSPADCKAESFYFMKVGNLDKRVCSESAQMMQYYPKVSSLFVNNTLGGSELCAETNNEIRVVFQHITDFVDGDEGEDAPALTCSEDEVWDADRQACTIDDDGKVCVYSDQTAAEIRMSNFQMSADGLSANITCGLYYKMDGVDGSNLTFTVTDSGWPNPITAEEFDEQYGKAGEWRAIKEYCKQVIEIQYSWVLSGIYVSSGKDGDPTYGAGKLAREDMSSKYSTDSYVTYYMCEYEDI